jgi:hypothetical protein
MNAGVATVPWGSVSRPVRAGPQVASMEKSNTQITAIASP